MLRLCVGFTLAPTFNLWVHEDVVDVQINRVDTLGGVDSRRRHNDRLARLVRLVVLNCRSGTSTVSILEHRRGQLKEQVTSRGEHDLVLRLKVDRNNVYSCKILQTVVFYVSYFNVGMFYAYRYDHTFIWDGP